MISLTTRQRDLLRYLLDSEETLIVADLASRMGLSSRQVNYGLKGVRTWLEQRGIPLRITPGVGIELITTSAKRDELLQELKSGDEYELVLSAGQRRQLIALQLLLKEDPAVLNYFQDVIQVSRTTILKDLEDVEVWLNEFTLDLVRKPNQGTWLEGSEWKIRQALTALLWGETVFDDPIFSTNHVQGLAFSLESDAKLLPILEEALNLTQELPISDATTLVASAEMEMGGRFTDHEVLHLSLALAVQLFRIDQDQIITQDIISHIEAEKLHKNPVWTHAQNLLLDPSLHDQLSFENEVNAFAILLLAGAKNERWPGDPETEKEYEELIGRLLNLAEEAYELPGLAYDATLRDGLISNVIPACLRQQFDLWSPVARQSGHLSAEKYAFEHEIATDLADEVKKQTTYDLPDAEINNLAMLLRAAWIRERPHKERDVVIVCPSGMATAQLLMARLKARFPRLEKLDVVSMREIASKNLTDEDLILTTVPLNNLNLSATVIQVHPLLLPEDVATITNWLAK
ncbi:MAG: helix-turn-helix domain-containing protein [Chloroflexota bacterium]